MFYALEQRPFLWNSEKNLGYLDPKKFSVLRKSTKNRFSKKSAKITFFFLNYSFMQKSYKKSFSAHCVNSILRFTYIRCLSLYYFLIIRYYWWMYCLIIKYDCLWKLWWLVCWIGGDSDVICCLHFGQSFAS